MKTTVYQALLMSCAMASVLFMSGCASTATYENVRTLPLDQVANTDLSNYTSVSVMAFEVSPDVTKVDAQFGKAFAGHIAGRLRTDFPALFEEVRWDRRKQQPRELIVTGTISKYVPGSADLRFAMWLGPSFFNGEVTLKDGGDGHILCTLSFNKLWAWGGMLGGGKTIDGMVNETAVAITKTIVQLKNRQNATK